MTYRCRGARLEYSSMSDQSACHKTYQEKLRPTPAQERELERVLWRCRTLYNAALEQRITLWKQRGVSRTRYQQEAELKSLRTEMPEYGALHSHVLQDVLARLDGPIKLSAAAWRTAKSQGFPGSTAKTATTPSPTKSMATAPASRTATLF